jgi:hypothetical protein
MGSGVKVLDLGKRRPYDAGMRRGQGIAIVAAVVATTGLLALTSAPAGAGEPAQSGTVVTPFEQPSAFPRFKTFPWYWAGNPAVITVDNKIKKLRDPIKKALSIWNHSGIDIKWKLKSSDADVKVVPYGNLPCGFGLATTNYNPNGQAYEAIVNLGTNSNPKKCLFTDVITAAHEFGHVLGLDHEDDKCAVMNSSSTSGFAPGDDPNPSWPTQCDPQTDKWYCRVLSEDDLKGAKTIYGGHPKVKSPEFCPVSEPLR